VSDFQKMRALMQQMGQGGFPGMPGMFGGMGSLSSIWKSCFATWLRGYSGAAANKKRRRRKRRRGLGPLKVSASLKPESVNLRSVKVVKLYIHYLKKRISP